MHYTIRHVTRFTYETPISEGVMETRMQPRSEGAQRCLHFGLSTVPAARVLMYQDHEGNAVHHFNIPAKHARLTVTAEALVECNKPAAPPDSLDTSSWDAIDAMRGTGEFWDLVNPSAFATTSALLDDFAREIAVERKSDPLTTLRWLTDEMFKQFEYSPQSTRVDSPIDDALQSRQGVCQDFTHIMIALVRRLGMPCRYVSGYLFSESGSTDRCRTARRTRGSKRFYRSSGGSASIRPTIFSRASVMSGLRWEGITQTCRRRGASTKACRL